MTIFWGASQRPRSDTRTRAARRSCGERIAALCPGAGPENVLVTVGAIQANLTALTALTQRGDELGVVEIGPHRVKLYVFVAVMAWSRALFADDPWHHHSDAANDRLQNLCDPQAHRA